MIQIETILQKLADNNLIRLSKKTGNYYQIYCPFHKNGTERNPSCGVLLQDEYRNGQLYPAGWFHCFTCGYADVLPKAVERILQNKNIPKSGLDWLKENIPGFDESQIEFEKLIPNTVMQQLNNAFAINYIMSKNVTVQPTYINEEELASYRYTVPYMYERKLTDEVIEKFDVGVDLNYIPYERVNKVPCITFPVRDPKGNVLFIARRAIEKKAFYLPRSMQKPVYGLYELPDNADKVVICESCFNALTCYVYGIPGVALLGTSTPYQISQLKTLGVKEFILGLDPDEAGDRGCRKLKNALKSIGIVRRMNIPPGKDINDLTEAEFTKALEERI